MRPLLLTLAGLLFLVPAARAADNEPKALIEKAVKAMGGEERLAKIKAYRVKGKGTLDVMGLSLEFTSNGLGDLSGRLRSDLELDIMGQKVNVIQVCDGKKAWAKIMNNVMELEGDLLKEMKEEMHAAKVALLLPVLKDNAFTLAPIGEIKIDGKTAFGVKVSAKGFRDVDLYFDQGTGLVVKTVRQALDTTTMKEVTQESIFSEFKDESGLKVAHKAVVQRDGKKFMTAEVVEYKPLESVDDSEFAKP